MRDSFACLQMTGCVLNFCMQSCSSISDEHAQFWAARSWTCWLHDVFGPLFFCAGQPRSSVRDVWHSMYTGRIWSQLLIYTHINRNICWYLYIAIYMYLYIGIYRYISPFWGVWIIYSPVWVFSFQLQICDWSCRRGSFALHIPTLTEMQAARTICNAEV